MVKATDDRDYYADLEIKPSADANEVKKQFKKLGMIFLIHGQDPIRTNALLSAALKYHPDRNPGKEVEFNAKFQSIQSAHEILTDPQLRAKYDAQRIRSGLLHTYTDAPPPPPRPNVHSRPPNSKFAPPPPRPTPSSATKPTFPPPPSNSQKYARFNRPESATSWRNTNAEDAKSKTNDFKAWEHMRHGQGPIPRGRAVPPKPPKVAPFQSARNVPSGREADDKVPKGTTPRQVWEHRSDAGMTRANTTRPPPKKTGFAPGSPGGDEPQAHSAYFNISRGERPTTSRAQMNMAPPPGRTPTAKKPDPLQAFKGANDLFGGNKRVSTPYSTGGGEKTAFTSPGLQRSSTTATPRDSNSRTDWYDNEPLNADGTHARAASSSAAHVKADTKLPGMYASSTSSSSSSSDEAEQLYTRPKHTPKTRRTRMPAGSRQRSFFNPNVRVDEAEDEPMAPQSGLGDTGYTGPRRHSGINLPTYNMGDDRLEGFMEHRMKHEADQIQQQSESAPTAFKSGDRDGPQRFMQRPKSFDEKYRSPPQDKDTRPATGDIKDRTPMYDPGYNPFYSLPSSGPPSSEKWSEQWPFKSPKKARVPSAEPPPYWAIPSCLPPIKQADTPRRPKSFFPLPFNPKIASVAHADCGPLNSFRWPTGDAADTFAGKPPPPLRSQSSETIDMKFRPPGAAPKFAAGNGFSAVPSPRDNPSTHNGGFSPFGGQTLPKDTETSTQASSINVQATPGLHHDDAVFPPPPQGPAKYSSEDWNHRFSAGTFQYPLGTSPTRTSNRKRAGTPRTSSLNNMKRAGAPRPGGFQPNVVDASDEPTTSSTTGESLSSSKTSSNGSAMDIDPILTPPSANEINGKTNGDAASPTPARPDVASTTPRQGPSVPPRPNPHSQPEAGTGTFNMNLSDFKDVKPFAPSAEGLNDIDDLKTALPFESRASPTQPSINKGPQRSNLPRPPKAPPPPVNLTQSSWERYLADMGAYMYNWTNFNSIMLRHFQSRQESQKEMNPKWMSSMGGDFDAYLEGILEDVRLRKYWEVASDHHKECINQLGMVRKKIMNTKNVAV